MRAYRLVLGLLTLTVAVTIAPPAGAAPPPPKAETVYVVDSDDFGNALAIVACTGTGPVEESARVVVECDLYDSSGGPSIHHQRSYPGFAGVCFIAAQGVQMPLEFCTTVTVTYRDLSTQSRTHCLHYGESIPPHNPPPPFQPTATECFDFVRLSA